jgi:hypothetical protein
LANPCPTHSTLLQGCRVAGLLEFIGGGLMKLGGMERGICSLPGSAMGSRGRWVAWVPTPLALAKGVVRGVL